MNSSINLLSSLGSIIIAIAIILILNQAKKKLEQEILNQDKKIARQFDFDKIDKIQYKKIELDGKLREIDHVKNAMVNASVAIALYTIVSVIISLLVT